VAIYAVGDLQGCLDEFEALLEALDFDPVDDRLWLVGDLVNRGPRSLETLRCLRGLDRSLVAVLGNHDLHLLATAHGTRALRPRDTFQDILEAPDRDELLEWLRHRPVLHLDRELDLMMVHAGLAPEWSVDEAVDLAAELEEALRGPRHGRLFERMYGNRPDRWSPALEGDQRLRFLVNAFTRIRYVDRRGRLELGETGAPGTQPEGLAPWFAAAGMASLGVGVIFGHWSTLPPELAASARGRFHALDTGCVWGGRLTALRIADDSRVSVAAGSRARHPGLSRQAPLARSSVTKL
jgi:bis(5'-nucleosyl)-tetraphosphatase (symmetrical)